MARSSRRLRVAAYAFGLLIFAQTHAEVQCLDANRVQRILSQFKIESETDEQGQSILPELNLCDENQIEYTFLQSMIMMEDLPPLNSTADQFNQNILVSTPYEFFTHQIGTVIFDSPSSAGCRDGLTAAYVKMGDGRRMHICTNSRAPDSLFMLDVLIHEARHVDGFIHVLCNRGRWAGVNFSGCDNSYYEQGSYAVETELNIRLARTEAVKPEDRQHARVLAVQTLLENFNDTPFGLRLGWMTEDDNSQVGFFDGKTVEPLFQKPASSDILVLRAQTPTVYSPASGDVRSYLSAQHVFATDGIYSRNFRDSSPDLRATFRDLLYVRTTSCFLNSNHLRCDDGDRVSELNLTTIQADHLILYEDQLAVVDRDGYVYTILSDLIGTRDFTEAHLLRSSVPLGFLGLSPWSGGVAQSLGLGRDGILRIYANGDLTKGEPLAGFENQRFRRLLGPTWWSSELANF